MTDPECTVLLPTTGDRSVLVELAVRSVLAQTRPDFELFVVGDGVTEPSASRLERLAATDERIRFRPFPKGERRGEPCRDELLRTEARGRVVAYITDRDLWLDHHLETVCDALADADFTHTLTLDVDRDGRVRLPRILDLQNPRHRRTLASRWEDDLGLPFSGIAHTLAAYRRLPVGWATTPERQMTDIFMWQKFLRQPWVRARTCFRPTYLYFRRGGHPGDPVEQRRAELARWDERLREERTRGFQGFYEPAIAELYRSRSRWFERWRKTLSERVRRAWLSTWSLLLRWRRRRTRRSLVLPE